MAQKIGPISNSRNIDIKQVGKGNVSQTVEAISSSDTVELRQLAIAADETIAMASELANSAERFASLPIKELVDLIQEEIGGLCIQYKDVEKAQAVLPITATASQPLKDSLSALAAASSIISGGITVASLSSPLAMAVALPLTAALAGLCDIGAVSRLFATLRARLHR